ncbi:MAG: motility associated factor glycosyltransferase family protein [Treponemataceae bacterium]
MKSIFQNNIDLFAQRFPELFEQLSANYESLAEDELIPQLMNTNQLEIKEAKSGCKTITHKGRALHSMYDPQKEAKKLMQITNNKDFSCGVFFSMGLGYAVHEFVSLYPQKKLVVIEPSMDFFLAALAYFDFSSILNHAVCILFVNAPQPTVISILEKIGLQDCICFKEKNQMQHSEEYFMQLDNLITRNMQKKSINESTLEKFSGLWLNNTCKNLEHAINCGGIARYEKKTSLPVCVIAAGPTLDDYLPFLPEIKNRCIIVCVDTALKAVLKTGTEPHFIVVSDPQYWNYCHLMGLSAKSSILITELATYPAVFQFPCKEIILCSSLYPLGKFIENHIGQYGEIGAGGSVATTAWDFARFIGSTTIFLLGLDLGFPENKTHYKGSTFEERIHLTSNRLLPAENNSARSLYEANAFFSEDYNGNPILTDARMSLYAWWFESKVANYPAVNMFSLSAKSLKIKGIKTTTIEYLLDFPENQQQIEDFIQTKNIVHSKTAFLATVVSAKNALQEIDFVVQKGCLLIDEYKHLENRNSDKKTLNRKNEILLSLEKIDSAILACKGKDLASLVFPTEKQLAVLLKNPCDAIEKSSIIYDELQKSIATHLTQLEKAIAQIKKSI